MSSSVDEGAEDVCQRKERVGHTQLCVLPEGVNHVIDSPRCPLLLSGLKVELAKDIVVKGPKRKYGETDEGVPVTSSGQVESDGGCVAKKVAISFGGFGQLIQA